MNKNIDIRMVEKNRANITKFGATFGSGFFTPKKENCILDFNERKANADKFDLMPSRNISRYKLGLVNITGVNMSTDAEGENIVVVSGFNDTGKEVSISCSVSEPNFAKKPTSENLQTALQNGEPAFFSNPRELKKQINDINLKEKTRVSKLIEELEGYRDALTKTIADNDEKVDNYYKQLDAKSDTDIHLHMTVERD